MIMPLFGGYKASKLKPQLKMAVTRLQIAANKKSALMKQQIRDIARLLAEDPPKEEKARIKAEGLIRDDYMVEAYEILQLNCELLSERIQLITHMKECPPDLVESISTVIWASSIVDIPELIEIRKQFRYKFGKTFEEEAIMNVGGIINERVAEKLSVQPPSAYLVQTYLEKIADEHEVDWKPERPLKADEIAEPMSAPSGYSVPVGGGSGLNPSTYVQDGGASAPPASPPIGNIPEAPRNGGSTASTVSTMSSTKQSSAYVPVLPTPTVNANVMPSKMDDIEEEVDIFVPGNPKTVAGSDDLEIDIGGNSNNGEGGESESASRDRTQSAGENPQSSSKAGGSSIDDSYDDLAARFAQLQR
mmetsp:Transcript_29275/g.66114  ORF Transcript_29275/g.66114 Transcript_29275/m.66114 type:complete len:361 (+) Transcript_29275:268-1350(+)